MKAIRVHEQGPPDVLHLENVDSPSPGKDEVVVAVEASGVNFIDVNQRSGAYAIAPPFTPGTEGAGVVIAIGSDVTGFAEGDRVAFAVVPGAYAEQTLVPARRLVPLPESITTKQGAAALLQGMTAHYLVNSICTLREGDWCLIHAAAGGVGSLLVQMAKRRGLNVIGATSTDDKAARVRATGADHVVISSREDIADVVRSATGGEGVRIVFESVGRDTIDASFDSLARRGHLVLFGQASGSIEPVSPGRLQRGGSLFFTRPGLVDYISTREELLWRSGEVFELIASGALDVHVDAEYALCDAAEAHRALESRTTTGKLLLIPSGNNG